MKSYKCFETASGLQELDFFIYVIWRTDAGSFLENEKKLKKFLPRTTRTTRTERRIFYHEPTNGTNGEKDFLPRMTRTARTNGRVRIF